MTRFPRVTAAFINAIAEEGTKEEAVGALQDVWDEFMATRRALRRVMTEAGEGGPHGRALDLLSISTIDEAYSMLKGHNG